MHIRNSELPSTLTLVRDDPRGYVAVRDRTVMLGPQEFFAIPRRVEHCPRTDTETAVLLFEPSTIIKTGDAGGDLTAEVEGLT